MMGMPFWELGVLEGMGQEVDAVNTLSGDSMYESCGLDSKITRCKNYEYWMRLRLRHKEVE